MDEAPCILGVAGWSGSGKTTLIERSLPALLARGRKVAVVKMAGGHVQPGRPGSDSERLFRAGADVWLEWRDGRQWRAHEPADAEAPADLGELGERYDLVLMEGGKREAVEKVWLAKEGEPAAPADVPNVLATLPPGEGRFDAFAAFVDEWLTDRWRRPAVGGCVLIGGQSRRMGRPKHLLQAGGRSWLARTVGLLRGLCAEVVAVGAGEMPEDVGPVERIDDAPGLAGPMAGILAAMRRRPRCTHLVAACDMPDLSAGALRWLLDTRAPGVWATLPRLAGAEHVEPLLAHYDLRARRVLEAMAADGELRPGRLARHPKVVCPAPPREIADAWRNVNTPDDLRDSYR